MLKKQYFSFELSNWNSPLWASGYLLVYCLFLGALSLELSTASLNPQLKIIIFLMEWALIGFTSFDIYFIYFRKLHFHSSFISRGTTQVDKSRSKLFPLDVLSLFPFFTFFISYDGAFASGLKIFFALVHLSQFRFFTNIVIEYHFLAKRFKALIFLILIFFIVHSIGVLWILVGQDNQVQTLDLITRYNLAMYWAITTLTTVGYGDITPHDNLSRLYTMFIMLLGVASYGVIIGTFIRMIASSSRYAEERREKLRRLQDFVDHHNLGSELKEQIYSFYSYVINKKESEVDKRVLSELPLHLQAELKKHIKINLIKNIDVFSFCSYDCLVSVANKLEEERFSPQQTIFDKGYSGEKMYAISHGLIEISIGDKKIAKISTGDIFGEMALINKGPRTAKATALDFCDLYTLSRENFEEVCLNFPDLGKQFQKIYETRKT